MRLPRVRLTVGKMLLAVAVVATNCGAVRLVAGAEGGAGISYSLALFTGCFLPLINVALVGTWLYLARWLRTSQRGGEEITRPQPAGVTFFSLQILVLGLLVCVLMPDLLENLPNQESVSLLVRRAYAEWEKLHWLIPQNVSDFLLGCSLLAVFLWSPMLLLAWIGGLLAKRYARGQSRRRFRVMACLVTLGFALAGLAVCVMPVRFREERDVDLQFRVVDSVSGDPVASAFVCVVEQFAFPPTLLPPRALSDSDGHARFVSRFDVTGERIALQKTGVFSPWGRWLEISAQGHRRVCLPLSEVLGTFVDPARVGCRQVRLDRGKTPEHRFKHLAGEYSSRAGYHGGAMFRIEPDGRFAWSASSCTASFDEYGYVRQQGCKLDLAPIPHPGSETHPFMTMGFRIVPWGDRMYLCLENENVLSGLCSHALFPNRHWIGEYECYLRESDLDKPQTGLPRLPLRIWARFLASELSPSNEEGSLRLALDSLSRMKRRERVELEARAN